MRTARPVVGVALVAALVLGAGLGGRVLGNNDEARFAVLAQDILARGHWTFPELNGVAYYNKPVLLAWLIAAVSWPLGHVTQLTAVLPSAVAGVVTVLAVYAVGRELFGPTAAIASAAVVLTTQGLYAHARVPLPDMLMTAFVTLALWMLGRVATGHRGPSWAAFWAFTAGAFWAKGPAGFLPLAIALVWTLLGDRRQRLGALRPGWGLALLVVLVAPWWLLAFASNSSAARRSVESDQLLWYLPSLPALHALTAPVRNAIEILLPWVVVLPFAARRALRELRARRPEHAALGLVLVWALVVLVLVGLSSQQRLRYYLPMVPPAALLVGWWVGAWMNSHREAAAERGWRGVVVRAAVVWCCVAALLVAVNRWATLRHNAAYDYPRVERQVRAEFGGAHLIAAWGLPELPLSFYSGRPVLAVETLPELERLLAADSLSVAVVTDQALARLADRPALAVLMAERLGGRSVSLVGLRR